MRWPVGPSTKGDHHVATACADDRGHALAGLALATQKLYAQAVCGLAAHDRRSPDQLSEDEVRGYLLGLRQRWVARGTFKTSHYRLRFVFHHTLGQAWRLFGGKKDRLATTEAAA
jgi:hypothetical protein